MTFRVIDTKTGDEPTSRVIDNVAKKGGLIRCDIDQFYVGEDGSLVLADDCGNITYCDAKRFEVETERSRWMSDEILLMILREVSDYCAERKDCEYCKFGKKDGGGCMLYSSPDIWEIPGKEEE